MKNIQLGRWIGVLILVICAVSYAYLGLGSFGRYGGVNILSLGYSITQLSMSCFFGLIALYVLPIETSFYLNPFRLFWGYALGFGLSSIAMFLGFGEASVLLGIFYGSFSALFTYLAWHSDFADKCITLAIHESNPEPPTA